MKATTIRKAGAAALAGAMAFSCASCALFGPNKKEIVEAGNVEPGVYYIEVCNPDGSTLLYDYCYVY